MQPETPGHFSMESAEVEGGMLIRLGGNINSTFVHKLREQLLGHARTGNIYLSMENVKLLTSAGVGTLFEILDEQKRNGRKLVLINPSAHIQSLIAMTGIGGLFPISGSIDEAMKLQ